MDLIINRIEELMHEYRNAKMYGEFFGLKIALEILKKGRKNMNKELNELYQNDEDFKRYCDEWCRKHNTKASELFDQDILREYAKWLKEQKK